MTLQVNEVLAKRHLKIAMLDKKARKKLLAEAKETVELSEELFREHANDFVEHYGISAQFKSYWLLSCGVNRCRQLKVLLDAEKLKYDNERLERIIGAFDTLEKPQMDEILLF